LTIVAHRSIFPRLALATVFAGKARQAHGSRWSRYPWIPSAGHAGDSHKPLLSWRPRRPWHARVSFALKTLLPRGTLGTLFSAKATTPPVTPWSLRTSGPRDTGRSRGARQPHAWRAHGTLLPQPPRRPRSPHVATRSGRPRSPFGSRWAHRTRLSLSLFSAPAPWPLTSRRPRQAHSSLSRGTRRAQCARGSRRPGESRRPSQSRWTRGACWSCHAHFALFPWSSLLTLRSRHSSCTSWTLRTIQTISDSTAHEFVFAHRLGIPKEHDWRGRAAKPHHDARATRRALDRLPWLPRAAALSRGSRLSWGAWRARRTAASLPRRQ